VVLLQGIIIFTFVAESTQGSVSSLVDKEILVRKIQFPRLAIPMSIVMTALFNLTLNYTIVVLFLLVQGGTPHWTWFYEFPFLLAALIAFASGVSMLLAALYVRYRDIRPIWEVLLQTLYFISLILIPVEAVSNHTLRELLVLSPFAAIVQQLRHAVIDPGAPSVTDVLGSDWLLLVPVTILVAIVIIGYVVFDRMAPHVAEEL
jgi:ABC-2 type transport system permease protein